jgi:hypothetical protein
MCVRRFFTISSIFIRYVFQLSQSSSATGTGEAMGNKLGVHGPGPGDVSAEDKLTARAGAAFSSSTTAATSSGAANGGGNEDAEDPVAEVPPPMQPISSLPVPAAASSTSVDQKVSNGFGIFGVFHINRMIAISCCSLNLTCKIRLQT